MKSEQKGNDTDNLRVCRHCLMAIESIEGTQVTIKHYLDSEDTETKCDWCEETADEGGFDVLYELI